jgi:hypothetical protein
MAKNQTVLFVFQKIFSFMTKFLFHLASKTIYPIDTSLKVYLGGRCGMGGVRAITAGSNCRTLEGEGAIPITYSVLVFFSFCKENAKKMLIWLWKIEFENCKSDLMLFESLRRSKDMKSKTKQHYEVWQLKEIFKTILIQPIMTQEPTRTQLEHTTRTVCITMSSCRVAWPCPGWRGGGGGGSYLGGCGRCWRSGRRGGSRCWT